MSAECSVCEGDLNYDGGCNFCRMEMYIESTKKWKKRAKKWKKRAKLWGYITESQL